MMKRFLEGFFILLICCSLSGCFSICKEFIVQKWEDLDNIRVTLFKRTW